MTLICKCGHEHKDQTYLITKRDPIFNRSRFLCKRCGRRVFIKTVSPTEYKKLVNFN